LTVNKDKYTSVSANIFTGSSLQSLGVKHSTAPLMKPLPPNQSESSSSSSSSSNSSSLRRSSSILNEYSINNIINNNIIPSDTNNNSTNIPSLTQRRRSSRKSQTKIELGALNSLGETEGIEEEDEQEPESDLDEDEMQERHELLKLQEEENKDVKHTEYQLDYPKIIGGILPTVAKNELLEAERCDFYEGAVVYVRQQKVRVERCDWPLVFYRIFNPYIRDPQIREQCLPMVEDGVKYLLGPEKHRHFTHLSRHLFTVDSATRAQNLERKRSILTGTPESVESDENIPGYSQQMGWNGTYGHRSYQHHYLSQNDLESVG